MRSMSPRRRITLPLVIMKRARKINKNPNMIIGTRARGLQRVDEEPITRNKFTQVDFLRTLINNILLFLLHFNGKSAECSFGRAR